MHIGIDSFVAAVTDPSTGEAVGPQQRMAHLLEEIALADQVGLYSFGIGEHHRPEYYDSAPAIILAAAAARTERIRLGSAVTVLSAADPVRVFQQFATLDLISGGAPTWSWVAAPSPRPSRSSACRCRTTTRCSPRSSSCCCRSGVRAGHLVRAAPARAHRAGRLPPPAQDRLPIWVGVGGSPESFARAGLLGLPLMVAIIGGEPRQFAPLIDLYRRAGAQAGHAPEQLQVGLHVFGYVAESTEAAADTIYPGWHEMFTKISRERGFRQPTRAQFDATSGPDGAFFMGSPQTVAEKIRRISDQLGGVDRLSVQMTNPRLAHADLLRGIELLGTEVAPLVADA